MRTIRWGILSTGVIAHNFATTMKELNREDSLVGAVASRSTGTAQSFAEQYNIPSFYGSYEELVNDPEIDIVYICTPHNVHYENILLCLRHGKHVLCEKTFTISAEQATEVYALAKEKNLFLMEAFWTKFIPIYRQVEEIIARGDLGTIDVVTAQYGYSISGPRETRKFDPALAGGALLDIGVYNIGFASMIMGYHPTYISSLMSLHPSGTDQLSGIVLGYEEGGIAQITTSMSVEIPTYGCVYGTKGRMMIPNFKNPTEVQIYLNDGTSSTLTQEYESTGFEYQIWEAEKCIREGKQFSDIMTPEQSTAVMEIMDDVRAQWELTFPFEK